MTITRLSETKKGRFAIFADGEFLFSVHKDIFLGRPELALGKKLPVNHPPGSASSSSPTSSSSPQQSSQPQQKPSSSSSS